MPATNPTLTPDEALAVLLEGAERAALDRPLRPNSDKSRRELLRKEQHPIAAVVGCSDSRVPMEYAFDVGYGDLFAIRTAGHTLGETVIGSIEFAVEVLKVPLVMVLGHTSCGAVDAAKTTFDSGDTPPGNIAALVERILPSVVQAREDATTPGLSGAVEAHTRRPVKILRDLSHVLYRAEKAGKVKIVGAVYSLDTGTVKLVDPID